MVEIILVGLIASLLAGGSLRNLAQESLRGEWVLLVLLPAQLVWPVVSDQAGLDCALSIIIWLFMMSGLCVVLMLNAARRWMLALAALGIAANILVIGLNQGMPVSIRAASEVGGTRAAVRAALEGDCLHEEMDEETLARILGDVIAVPGPKWQGSVLSLGDVLLSLGLGAWIYDAARQRAA